MSIQIFLKQHLRTFSSCLLFLFVPLFTFCQARHQIRLHLKEYQNYEAYLFYNIRDSLSRNFRAHHLKCYEDKGLKKTIPYYQAEIKDGQCEHIRLQRAINDTATFDTLICTPFDYTDINQIIMYGSFGKDSSKPEISSLGLGYRIGKHSGQKTLYYLSAKEAFKYFDEEQNYFLEEFLEWNGRKTNKSQLVVSLDSGSMAQFARKQLNQLSYFIFNKARKLEIKSYPTDSFNHPIPNMSYVQLGDTITGMVTIFYLNENDHNIQFTKTGSGVLYYPILNNVVLPEQPLFYNKYDDVKQYCNPVLDKAFRFYERIGFFELHNDWFKDTRIGGIGH